MKLLRRSVSSPEIGRSERTVPIRRIKSEGGIPDGKLFPPLMDLGCFFENSGEVVPIRPGTFPAHMQYLQLRVRDQIQSSFQAMRERESEMNIPRVYERSDLPGQSILKRSRKD